MLANNKINAIQLLLSQPLTHQSVVRGHRFQVLGAEAQAFELRASQAGAELRCRVHDQTGGIFGEGPGE